MAIDQRDLFNFYTVVCQRSFNQAANHLGVSKGYISKSIKRLEQQIANKLIHRSARHWQLTAAGEQLFQTAQSMQLSLGQGLEQLQIINQSPSGCLKISAPPAVAETILAPIFSTFLTKNPNITIDMHLDTKLVDIISGGYDLVFRGSRLEDSNLIARKLFDVEHRLVASPNFFKHHLAPCDPTDLENLPCIGYLVDGRVIWNFTQSHKNRQVTITPKLTSNLSSMLKQCAIQGAGITRLLSFMATDALKSKQLIEVLPDWQCSKLPLYVVYPSREFLPFKTKALLEYLIEHFKKVMPKVMPG